LGFNNPESVFDIKTFKENPSLFYTYRGDDLNPSYYSPGPTHKFIAKLDAFDKLRRLYKQNIGSVVHIFFFIKI
jgi:NAD-dependent histone deacetylase SIR2